MYIYIYMYTCTRMYIHDFMCVCVFIYINIHIYVCIPVYICSPHAPGLAPFCTGNVGPPLLAMPLNRSNLGSLVVFKLSVGHGLQPRAKLPNPP